MGEVFTTAITGMNIIPTTVLGLMLIYWLIAIIGVLDISSFDIDFDADGASIDLLNFLKLNNVPITIYVTIWVLYTWSISMVFTYYTGINNGILGYSVFIGILFVSLMMTSYSTLPLKGIFKDMGGLSLENETPLIGQLCTLKFDLADNKTSQAQLDEAEDNILINVQKFNKCADLKRGEKALIIEVDKEKNIYLIEPYNTNKME